MMDLIPPLQPTQIVVIPSLDPIGEPTRAAGYAASVRLMTNLQGEEHNKRAIGVKTVYRNPLLMRRLADRVYELMQDDLRQAKERQIYYGGRL